MSDKELSTEESSRRLANEDCSLGSILRAWLGRQSLPRILGLFVGNTRELENTIALQERLHNEALDRKDKEIARLSAELAKWSDHAIALQDSHLIGQGMVPTQLDTQPRSVITNKPTVSYSGQAEIDVEVDKLIELTFLRPEEAQQKVLDFMAVNTPQAKEIANRYMQWIATTPDIDDGVVVAH